MAIKTNIYKMFPKGSHRMPDGTIMKNKDMYKHRKGRKPKKVKVEQARKNLRRAYEGRKPNNNPSTRGTQLKTS